MVKLAIEFHNDQIAVTPGDIVHGEIKIFAKKKVTCKGKPFYLLLLTFLVIVSHRKK